MSTDSGEPGPRVRIVHLDPETLAALAAGDLDAARRTSPVPLSAWLASPHCTDTWQRRATQVLRTPADQPWVTGVVLAGAPDNDPEGARDIPVGKAGFHAAPDADGMVEVGYSVDPALRRRGYARAALRCLVERARTEAGVRVVRASVSPDNAASLTLVRSEGFVEVGEQWDEVDGLELVLELVLHR